MKHSVKHHHRRATKKVLNHRSAKRATVKRSKGGLMSWLTGRLPFMKGGFALAEESAPINEDTMLLPASMRGSPQGVDVSTAPAFHVTTGGSRKQRKQRKQHKQRTLRGGMAPVDAPDMLLPSEMYAQAYLNKEWPAAGGSRRHRKH